MVLFTLPRTGLNSIFLSSNNQKVDRSKEDERLTVVTRLDHMTLIYQYFHTIKYHYTRKSNKRRLPIFSRKLVPVLFRNKTTVM
jgi:hypothetical protein